MYLNKAFVYGNLTRDPEIRSLPSGQQVASFGIATNRVYKDREGARKESTEFHNIVTFGRQAELVGQYLKKGSSALVEGRMQTRSWDAPDGQKKFRTEIVAERIQFGPRYGGAPQSGAAGAGSVAGESAGAKDEKGKNAPPTDAIEYPSEEINPDDIPF